MSIPWFYLANAICCHFLRLCFLAMSSIWNFWKARKRKAKQRFLFNLSFLPQLFDLPLFYLCICFFLTFWWERESEKLDVISYDGSCKQTPSDGGSLRSPSWQEQAKPVFEGKNKPGGHRNHLTLRSASKDDQRIQWAPRTLDQTLDLETPWCWASLNSQPAISKAHSKKYSMIGPWAPRWLLTWKQSLPLRGWFPMGSSTAS